MKSPRRLLCIIAFATLALCGAVAPPIARADDVYDILDLGDLRRPRTF